jgi:hypothetical protein
MNNIEWLPLEGLEDWPEVGEGQEIICYCQGDGHMFSHQTDPVRLSRGGGATHYAIIDAPVKERKLKPCPWCKVRPVPVHNPEGGVRYYYITHKLECPICDTTAMMPHKADAWGWE